MIIGHERQVEYLNRVQERGRLAHAYLFYGPEHAGKMTIAKALAKTLRCLSPAAFTGEDENKKRKISLQSPCGKCAECRMIDEDTHPQVIVLDRIHTLTSEKETRKDIPIADIRELKRRFSLAPEGERWRVAIINEADTMNEESASAFLKLLEEPGSQTLLILISSAPDLLLETIRSRAHQIRFTHVAEEKIVSYLESEMNDRKSAREIADRAFGRPGIALRMARDAQYREREKKFMRRFEEARAGGILHMLSISKDAAGDEDARRKITEEVLRLLRRRLRDAVEHEDVMRAVEKIRAVDRIATLLDTTNVNPRLALDAMFLEIAD